MVYFLIILTLSVVILSACDFRDYLVIFICDKCNSRDLKKYNRVDGKELHCNNCGSKKTYNYDGDII
jgi:hypothetical protein